MIINSSIIDTFNSSSSIYLASYVHKSVAPINALMIGTTYLLVTRLTRPFFQENGIIPFIFNGTLSIGIANLTSYSLSVMNTANITLISATVALEIISLSVVIFSIFSMLNYIAQSF